jgi:hypothetical protein
MPRLLRGSIQQRLDESSDDVRRRVDAGVAQAPWLKHYVGAANAMPRLLRGGVRQRLEESSCQVRGRVDAEDGAK